MISSLIRALSTHLSLIPLSVASHHLSSRVTLQEQEYKAVHVAQYWPTSQKRSGSCSNCSPAEITHAQLYADSTVRQLYVSLTAPPCPSIRHRLDDLITHPGSQRAFVADLAAGGISPPETLRYTAGARVQGSKRCSVMHSKPYAQRLVQ